MEGLSPGISGEPFSVSWERGSVGEACPSPCDRGCAPGECTFKLPKLFEIIFSSAPDFIPYLLVRSGRGDSEEMHNVERKVSLDKLVRMISTSTEVEEVIISMKRNCPFQSVVALLEATKNIPSLRSLTLDGFHTSAMSVSDAEAIFSVLVANNTLRECDVRFSYLAPTTVAIVKVMVDALLQNQVLQQFMLSIIGSDYVSPKAAKEVAHESSGMKELSRYLKAPTNVLTVLRTCDLRDDELIELANSLGLNKKLQELWVERIGLGNGEAIGRIGDALRTNTVLEYLILFGETRMEIEEMKAVVGALIPDATFGLQPNTSLRTLHFGGETIEGKEGMEQLATLVRSNTSLLNLTLSLSILELENENVVEYVEILFTALRFNTSLESLDLSRCSGIRGKQVLGMIMDMLLHNQTLRNIDLEETGLEKDGDAEVVYAELRARNKEVDRELEKVVASMERVPPTSARIFLCGNPEAGKTTLCQRWKKIHDMQSKPFTVERRKHVIFQKIFPCIVMEPKEVMVQSENFSTSSLPLERTRGIEVHNMVWKGMEVSMWDMAGQHEYHAFHDMVLPNQSAKGECCFYLIVCDPSKHWHGAKNAGMENLSFRLKEEIGYWLMFLASNTRRSKSYRPHVTILLTHHDVWAHDDWLLDDLFEDIVLELKEKFQAFLDFDSDLLFIKMANTSQESHDDEMDAEMVQQRIEEFFEQLSLKLPKILKTSKEMLIKVTEWQKRHPNDYILKWEKFSEDVFGGVRESLSWKNEDKELLEKVKKRIATSLHSGGHIMYFEDIGMVIMNPHWFCNKVMGNILFHCTTFIGVSEKASSGIIPREKLRRVVDKEMHDTRMDVNHFDNILNVMTQLQICYEDDHGKVIIPSILSDVSYTIDWNEPFSTRDVSYYYMGISLKTLDNTITLPTAGFFPRLQAYLHNKYVSNPSYKIYLNVISFISENDGINVFVICKEGSINILSRSVGDKNLNHHALHKMIVNHINDLRQKPTLGCPGVVFEEHIIRPECVENPSKKRLQSVSKKHLKEIVLRTGDVEYEHIWDVDEENRHGCHPARELFDKEEWHSILQSRNERVKEMNKDLDKILSAREDMHNTVQSSPILDEASCSNSIISDDPHQVFMAKRFDSMKKLIQGNHEEVMERLIAMEKRIINSQETLTARVCSNIDHLMESLLLLKDSNIPKLPCLMRSNGTNGKCILLKMVPSLTTFHLQFRCEHNDHFFHLVDGQPGCEIEIGNDTTRKFGVVMFWGLTISTMLLKVGAHLVGGMGSMVPDLARGLATVLDTPGLLDLAQPKGGFFECLPADFKENKVISLEDNEQAKAWLEKVLATKQKSKSMYDMFKLSQVEYSSKSSKRKEIGWVCDAHRK